MQPFVSLTALAFALAICPFDLDAIVPVADDTPLDLQTEGAVFAVGQVDFGPLWISHT